ncbi:hypothetical protein [Sabulicella glaciei]|uniref:Uncharacterized protein n=1 Tax=Sabulicella glaciei TaxID=2984948 RepID=A0ABT3NSH5_9PROT|nr:hypothetical protein [Roseococcus sp. MDT2-1-1]MCW8084818.1 hypothetical protein [Roseococcus sp. MDT2-1-1]
MKTRFLPFLLLAACAQDPVTDYLGGFGDPLRGAALYAPRNLGDTSVYAGDPAGAAMAAAQMEFLARSFTTDPVRGPSMSPTLQPLLEAGRDEMRGYLGIARGAPGEATERRLRGASEALRAGDEAAARAALSEPGIFTAGAAGTLARLAAMPALPRVREAAGAVNAELARLDRPSRFR